MKTNQNARLMTSLRGAALSLALLAGSSAALAQVTVDIGPPPAPEVETIPPLAAGQAWAPGYWNIEDGHWVWRHGHVVEARPGYRWDADRWDNQGGWHYVPGHFERDDQR